MHAADSKPEPFWRQVERTRGLRMFVTMFVVQWHVVYHEREDEFP